jgi:hypothetical protein
MNSYLWLHRIKGPAMLLVFGITALLNEWDIISYGRSWPLYLIVLGVLQLAERAAWSQYQQGQQAQYAAQYGQAQYPAYGATPGQTPGPYTGPTPPPQSSTALIIPPHDHEGR